MVKKINIKKKTKENDKEAIEELKKSIVEKTSFNKSKIKNNKASKNEKQKQKGKKIKIKMSKKFKKIYKKKGKEEEEEREEEEEEEKEEEEKKEEKNNMENNGQNLMMTIKTKKDNAPTLLELIKNKNNLEEIQITDGTTNKSKNNHKKKEIQKKELSQNINIPKNDQTEKNEYIKKVKSKIVWVNGKMVVEKPDVGLINKKFNEEHNQQKFPKETIFISNEENITSLSFLKIDHTKKWTKEETDLFYKALELFGLDFSFLEIVLKPRKRVEIKRKYIKEKKENPKEVERAISARKNVSKMNDVLNLYKKQNNQNIDNNLMLTRGESFRKLIKENQEKIDFNKEYKDILNKENLQI